MSRLVPPTVCVVAEIGVNHDGQVERAIELVDCAAEAGADAVKLQLFDPRYLLSNQALLAQYQEDEADNVFDLLDNLKLSASQMLAVRLAARRHGLGFIVTPFSLENIDDLKLLDPDAVKIASPDAVNTPLLDAVAKLGKPLLISTGTCRLGDLAYAVGLIRQHSQGGCLLQCVSSYPTAQSDASLGAIGAIAGRYRVPVGYSDHTTDSMTGALAVAAGACVIEKHLTYDRAATGPDHGASLDPSSFGQYVSAIHRVGDMMGAQVKDVRACEADVRLVASQSLCARHDLAAGHRLTQEDLTVKRPGSGIPAAHLQDTLGRRLIAPVKANDLIGPDDLA